MPVVPSVVLPVADALSWDVSPGDHEVVVNLNKDDDFLKTDEQFNAAAVVAFARTRSLNDVRVLQGSSWHGGMLRCGGWLAKLRRSVAAQQGWHLHHVYTRVKT